jgi:hypothetical protein
MKLTKTTFALLSTLVLGACAGEGDLSVGDTTDELRDRGPQKIQDGAEVLLLAVTDDDHAVYQDGQKLYAAALRKGAKKRFIADVPGDAIAYPLQVGDVVFLWLTPQRQFSGFGVSPLVLWDSKNGARRISERFDPGSARQVNDHRGLFGFTGTYQGTPVSVQTSGMGTPSLSIVVEELLRLGAKRLIRVGTCGGIARGMRSG